MIGLIILNPIDKMEMKNYSNKINFLLHHNSDYYFDLFTLVEFFVNFLSLLNHLLSLYLPIDSNYILILNLN